MAMITRFGSREICNVTFKAITKDFRIGTKTFKPGQPVFIIDTATASSVEQASTTVYAQGGRGYNRLISWEGEKTMTFNITDALMSPLGMKVLTGAVINSAESGQAETVKHIHCPLDVQIPYNATAQNSKYTVDIDIDQLITELGLDGQTERVELCKDANIKVYATKLDHNGAIADWIDEITLVQNVAEVGTPAQIEVPSTKVTLGDVIKVDLYAVIYDGATQIRIEPDSFGGYFYVEADTLYRNQDGRDMAATLTFPKVKVQSGFTLSMSPTGDPSTFEFIMDAFPAYTYFDKTKKVVCDLVILGGAGGDQGHPGHTTTEHAIA